MIDGSLLELWLVDADPDVAAALRVAFADCEGVSVACDDILALAENTIVSPANGQGFMDGGLDGQYAAYFGPALQAEVQRRIAMRPDGMLPVGASLLVPTGHVRIPFMIIAPTMPGPGTVDAKNAFFAMAAILNVASQHRDVVTKVYCPGLATGIGGVRADSAAGEMANAWRKWTARVDSVRT